MKIYLVRHGLAEERSPERPDAERALTKKGKRRTRQAMRGFARLDVAPLVLTSPLVRARQTAKLLAKALAANEAREESLLAPGGSQDALLERLRALSEDSVALVGHEPDLSELAKRLSGAKLRLEKAGIAALDGDPASGGATLEWLLTPLLLRRLRR